MTIKIITDSVSDLPLNVASENNITLVPCYINIAGKSYLDGVDISREEFYERLPEWKEPPTTAAPSPAMFEAAYQQAIEQGATGIVSIHVDGKLSNIFNAARLAAATFEQRIPIRVIDSGQISMGMGLLATAAAQFARDGNTLDEVVKHVLDRARRIHLFAALETLEYLKRSGRIAQLGSNLAGLLQIKPIVHLYAGKVSLEFLRTRMSTMKRLVEIAQKYQPLKQVAFVHANTLERVKKLYDDVKPYLNLEAHPEFNEVNPVIGTHVGPGAVGLIFETN